LFITTCIEKHCTMHTAFKTNMQPVARNPNAYDKISAICN